jgi:quercetin dioxygenase-like cupin family protein
MLVVYALAFTTTLLLCDNHFAFGADTSKEYSTPAVTAFVNQLSEIRRVVTGHTPDGEAVVVEDAICTNVFVTDGKPTFATTELWIIPETPGSNDGEYKDPIKTTFAISPPEKGVLLRTVEFPPDTVWKAPIGNELSGKHRTATVDFIYIIKGEIYDVLDKEEVLLKAGDVLIQRGTNHAWENRSSESCVMLAVLSGATEIAGLPLIHLDK